MGNFKKIISNIIITTMLTSLIPSKAITVIAETKDKVVSEAIQKNNEGSKEKEEPKIVREITEKREHNIKHFLNDDLSYEAVIYDYPVHYKENGQWRDIDNTLEEAKEDTAKEINSNTNNVIKNKQNNFSISFSKESNTDKLVKLQKDSYELTWGIEKSEKSAAEVVPVDKAKLDKEIEEAAAKKLESEEKYKTLAKGKKEAVKTTLIENEKKKVVEKANSSIKYSDIYPGIDLKYDILGDLVKENIIINKPKENVEFNFNIDSKGLVPKLQKDKSIIFYDEKDSNKAVFRMNAPFMFDSNNAESNNIDVTLKNSEQGYILSIKPDSNWLKDSKRVYPVTIDPPVETSLDIQSIQDTYVSSIDTENKYNNIFFRTGNVTNLGVMRSYLKFTLPQLKSSETVTNAQLAIYVNETQNGGGQVNVHKVLNDWNSSTLSWGNKPNYNSKIEEFQIASADNWMYLNVTSIAKEWYNSGNNYGLMLKNNNEASGVVDFRSSDTTVTAARPRVRIYYVSNSGLEDYWTYHSQHVGRAGTVYTNDFNGNVIHIHNDLSMTGNKMPTTINHIYNSSEVYDNFGMGAGWRLSVSQRIGWLNTPEGGYYTYTDEDGTVHHFKWQANTTEFKEELGLELTLSLENSLYVLKDKKSNKIIFSGDGYPISFEDNNGNKSTLQYETASGNGAKILTRIIDGANRTTTLVYNPAAALDHITDPNGNTTSFQYTNGNLTKINYPDGKSSSYNYDGNNYLTEVINFDGYMSKIDYNSILPKKAIKISEKNTNGTLGKELSIDYGYNTTRFTDYTGKKSSYQFNNNGQTVSIKDDNGNAVYNEYRDSTNITKLSESSKLQKSINNLFVNHSAEGNDGIYIGSDGGSGTSGYSTAAAYMGDRSIIVSKSDNISRQYMQQFVNLEKGKTYNFSAYVRTDGVYGSNNGGAKLGVHYQDKNGLYVEIKSKYITVANEWTRIDTSFTLPIDSVSTSVILRTYLENESGIAYFDAMQLEEGSVANRYNIIVNGDLAGSGQVPSYWGNHGLAAADSLVDSADKDHPSNYDNKVFKLTGAAGKDAKIGQGTNINGASGDTFVIGGWGKGASVPDKGTFGIQVVFVSPTGNHQWETVNFNLDSNDWQYVSKVIKSNITFGSVDVYLIYGNNANEAYFDGIQLYKEEFGESYTYDSKGNLVSVEDLAKQKSSFEYNDSNDMKKLTDAKGNKFQYDYYSNHNIKTATSAENVVYSFEYDSFGNPIVSKIGDSTTLIKSTATYNTGNGNYMDSITDSRGKTVHYNYDYKDGTFDSVTDANGNTTSYIYEGYQNNLKSATNVSGANTVTNSYSYENDAIKTITHNGFSYGFGYDSLGNNTTVNVGSQNLITNRFDDRTGMLLDSTYGNGQKVSNDYDGQGRVIAKKVAGDSNVGVTYQSQVQNVGWQSTVENGAVSGTTGQGLRLEALKISLKDPLPNMAIKYQVHVQNKGWMDLKSGGEVAGTIGESLRIEAIKIKLEGAPEGYRVRYQAYVEGYGWMDPQQDGEIAGTIGKGLRIEAIKIDVDKYRYAYKYDAAGNLAYLQDVVNGVSYKYIYDLANRLVAVEDSKGNGLNYGYDANNQRSSYSEKIQGSTYGTNYSYDNDGKPKTISYYRNNPINITFNYDAIGRMDNKIINTGTVSYKTGYKYIAEVPGQTTTKVDTISYGIGDNISSSIAYSYDNNGNIKSITENGKIIIYDYNSLNELTREDNQVLNKTIVYDYDNGGNIKTKTEYEPCIIGEIGSAVPKKVYSYAYNDLIWKDKLSSYEGQGITYDAIGNPVSYNGYTYAWEAGRQLKSISKNGQTIGYKYNDAGIRTEKTVNEITTKYKLVGDKVTFESNGTDYMYYTYDSEDNLVSVTMNGAEYYYVRNAQGDIIGLIDINGAEVVSYSYDSWGKLLSITGTLKDTVGVKNPYRYRGYRYDTETQLYYLQSRYYNPEWGRFINADGIIGQTGELLGHNLFAYSKNNPINMSDPSGFRPEFTLGEETEEMVEASLAVMMTAVESRNNASVGQVEVVPTASLSNLSATILGTSMGYVENISKKIVGYVGKDSVLQLLPPTSIAQTIQPYAKQAKFAAKAVTVVTAAFDIAHTWDSGTNLSLGQRVGKTALQVIGVGLSITVGTLVSGQLLAAGMATGGLLSVTGGILGAGAIDFLTGSLIGAGQDVIYKKYGLE